MNIIHHHPNSNKKKKTFKIIGGIGSSTIVRRSVVLSHRHHNFYTTSDPTLNMNGTQHLHPTTGHIDTWPDPTLYMSDTSASTQPSVVSVRWQTSRPRRQLAHSGRWQAESEQSDPLKLEKKRKWKRMNYEEIGFGV